MKPPIISIVGFSDSGKTTLAAALTAEFSSRGLRVGALKHAAHGFDMDRTGKDTYKFKQAGAHAVAASSAQRIAMVKDVETELTPSEIVEMYMKDSDLVLVEGYKRSPLPKIEALGFGEAPVPVFASEGNLIATVGAHAPLETKKPHFSFDQVKELADFLETILDAL